MNQDKYILKCFDCDWSHPEDSYITSCPKCNGITEVIYKDIPAEPIDSSYNSIFRFHRLMPYDPNLADISQYEDMPASPMIFSESLSKKLGIELYLKDETTMPTGTWKDREGFVSLYRLMTNKIQDMVLFSSGNTGTSLARSASIIKGPRLHIVVPQASKQRIKALSEFYHPDYVKLHFYPGSNDECIVHAGKFAKESGFPTENGFRNYARREGLKLLGLELILDWKQKYDWYVQPIAGGIGIYSLYKAYCDLGIADQCPRMLGVQADICPPMVNAWHHGASELEEQYIPQEVIPSDYVRVLRTRKPVESYPVLKKIMDKVNGRFDKVSEKEIHDSLRLFYSEPYYKELYHDKKTLVGLEPATALAGVVKAVAEKNIQAGQKVVLNVSGAAKSGDIKMEWIEDLL